jgi:hypothetical protein
MEFEPGATILRVFGAHVKEVRAVQDYNSGTVAAPRRMFVKRISLVTVLALSFCAASALAESYTGVVSDAMCAKNPAKASSPDHAACAKKCIEGGSPAVLIVGDKVYPVTNPATLNAYAGKKVTVDATMDNGSLKVNSVKE